MSTPASFVTGLTQGVLNGQRIWDNVDEERDETREEALALADYRKREERGDTIFDQQQEDRDLALGDRDRLIKQQDSDRSLARADHTRQVERETRLDKQAQIKQKEDSLYRAHQAGLANLSAEQQRRVSDARLNNNLTQQQVAELELKSIAQSEKAVEAQQLAAQASQLFASGEHAQGLEIYSQMNDLGFGTKDVVDGKYSAQEAEDVVQSVMSGETSVESPEFKKLAGKLLMPAFVASGRDPTKYEPAGIRESRPGFYAIEIKDKATGKIVPATHFASSDEGDPITEVSEESLIGAATSWLEGAREAENARDALQAQKQIASVQARFRTESLSKSDRRKAEDDEASLPANQQAFIELQPTQGEQNLAKLLIAEDGYDGNLPSKLRRIKKIAGGDNSEDKTISLSEALQEYKEETEINGIVAGRLNKLVDQGADPGKAEKLVRRAVRTGMSSTDYRAATERLIQKSKPPKPVERSASGRPIFQEADGTKFSEKTITFELDGKWVTFPTVGEGGKELSQDQVTKYLRSNGPIDPVTKEKFPLFDNEEDATAYAKQRSSTRLSDRN